MSLSQGWNNIVSKLFIGKFSDFISWKTKNAFNNTDYASNPMSLATFRTCINTLTDTMGKIPCYYYEKTESGKIKQVDSKLYDLLLYAPNDYQNQYTFWSTIEYHRRRYGDGYVKINWEKEFEPASFDIIHPDNVENVVTINNTTYYKVKGITDPINASNILHFKGLSEDGLKGIPEEESLKAQLNMMGAAYSTIENHYRNNIVSQKYLKSTLTSTNPLVTEKQMEKINEFNAGTENSGKWVNLPPNSELVNQDLKLIDLQYIESIKFAANQICASFGLSPIIIGDYTASKFNNMEQIQLQFKVNTVQTMCIIYESELNYKLLSTKMRKEGKVIEFDTTKLIEIDTNTKLNLILRLFNTGVLSPNQVAIEFGYPTFEGGDEHYIPTNNLTSIEELKQTLEELKNKANNNGTE